MDKSGKSMQGRERERDGKIERMRDREKDRKAERIYYRNVTRVQNLEPTKTRNVIKR